MLNPNISVLLWISICIGISCLGQNHHHHKDSTKTANEYMNQSDFETLVKRFESHERDAYQKPEKVLQYLGNIKNKTIVDIGAGTGYFSVKFAQKGAYVIAADVSEQFQNYLKKRIEKDNIKNITLKKIPYDSPELKENETDIVFMANTYHHIENRVEYFSKVKKGIKKNGSLLIIDFFKLADIPFGPPIDHKLSIDEVVSELKKAGYTSFDIRVDILPYQYIINAK